MPGLEQYMTPMNPGPAEPDWLRLMKQGAMVAPDQAQVAADQMPNPVLAPPPQEPNMSVGNPAPMPPVPMVNNFPVGPGLSAYMPGVSSSDRSLIDQYKAQSQKAMLDQQAGIEQLQKQHKDLSDRSLPVDWTALGGLVDSMNAVNGTKTNLGELAHASRGMTQEQKDDKLLKLQEYIQGAKGNMSKESLQALQQQLTMLHQGDALKVAAQNRAVMQDAAKERSQAFTDRNEISRENQMRQVNKDWNDDKIIKPQVDRLNQIKLDRHTLEAGGVVTDQVMKEIGNGIATALGGGKSAGWNAQEAQTIKSLSGDLANRRQYIEGKPFNALSPENKAFMIKLLTRLENGYGNAIARRAETLHKGVSYTANPKAQRAHDSNYEEYRSYGELDGGMSHQGGAPVDPLDAEMEALGLDPATGKKRQ